MPNSFTNLRIRAYLQTGVISDQYLPIDGILYNQAVRRVAGPQLASVPGQSLVPDFLHVSLPLLQRNLKQQDWYYAASFAQWPEKTIEQKSFWAKRFDVQHSDLIDITKKASIDTARGAYKNLFVKVYYRHCLYIDWYVVGSKESLEDLLRYCTHIGKETGDGWGKVLRWQVDDWPENWSVRGPDGKQMRAIPVENGDKGVLYGVRPSYWLPKHQFRCWMPQ